MSGSLFGKNLCVMTWGESHGYGIGAVLDGVPAGLPLSEEDIQPYLDRRKPGQSAYTTKRAESDTVILMSGVFEGVTEGTPISMMVKNNDQHSKDYGNLKDVYRPGHADYGFDAKFGIRDYRGGGRSSGRETAGRVMAGAIAAKILSELGISVRAYTKAIGPVKATKTDFSVVSENPLYMPDEEAAEKAEAYLKELQAKGDSAGGIIECVVTGLPAGIGEPVFEKLDANLAKAILSIGAVKGFEIGEGFVAAGLTGSENNDSFMAEPVPENERDSAGGNIIHKKTNHSGGTLGGMSDGSPLVFRAAVKPTPSISSVQETVTRGGENTEIVIKGRHDPVIVPRAVVVVECMAALTVADLLLDGQGSRLSDVKAYMETVRKRQSR
ncbi:MAG: chorismate synthase [Lachnospiraceae bacterium]|nr:chorismate synthase [Lachnospiraceae bacterium]